MFPTLTIGDKAVKYAIVQGGMAVRISKSAVAAAVANAGSIGTIGASGMTVEELRGEIRHAKKLLVAPEQGLIAVNIMRAIREFKTLLTVCIEENVDIVFIGAGLIDRWVVEMTEGTNTLIVPIISRAGVLKVLVKREGIIPAAIVAESWEAGGHLGTKGPEGTTTAVLAEVLDAIEKLGLNIPVIAAGGIRTGEDCKMLIDMGAAGVQLGIPFALTDEVRETAPGWQDVLLRVTEEIVTGGDFGPGSPTGYPGRYAVTPVIEKLIADGVVHFGDKRPHCEASCLEKCAYRDSRFQESLCIFRHLVAGQEGDYENGLFFTGSGIDVLDTIKPAAAIIDQLVEEYDVAK